VCILKNEPKFDTRFLSPEQTSEFLTVWKSPLSKAYATILKAFKHTNELPYLPTIFLTPFYIYVEEQITEGSRTGTLRMVYVAETVPDPDDPEDRWAICLLYQFVKTAPEEVNVDTLAHELVHFYSRAKGVDHSLDVLVMTLQGKSSLDIHRVKEAETERAEELFDEPVRWTILTMKRERPPASEMERKYCQGCQRVNYDEFYRALLGEERAKASLDAEVEKMKKRIRSMKKT
jgi:hypothetical protein